MKNLLLIGFLIFTVLNCQIANAQSRKERRQLRKQQTQQVEPSKGKETTRPDQPAPRPAASPTINNEKPDATLDKQKPSISKPVLSNIDGKQVAPTSELVNQIINNSKPVISEKPNGTLNWTEQFIEATGSSVINTERFSNPAQAKAMATRGAVVVAQRNLLEIINGVQVTSETTVKDMMAMGDFIYTRVDGIIKGAEMVGEPIEKDGMVEVRMRVAMYKRGGLAGALHEHIPQPDTRRMSGEIHEQLSKELQEQLLEGLAFNLGGKQFDPALFPVIVDENNKIVLDLSKIYDPNSGNFPAFYNTTQELFKEIGFGKGIEIIDVLKTEPGKLVIDDKNLKKINWKKIMDTATSIGKLLMLFI